jgi:hypothetical protein
VERRLLLHDDHDVDELINYEGKDVGRLENWGDKSSLDG